MGSRKGEEGEDEILETRGFVRWTCIEKRILNNTSETTSRSPKGSLWRAPGSQTVMKLRERGETVVEAAVAYN